MFTNNNKYASITAVLPTATSGAVVDAIIAERGASALLWRARGTLLKDRLWQRWVPPISPAKTMLQVLVPDDEVRRVFGTIVERGRLHQQATGAVFSSSCDHLYFGSEYHLWPTDVPATSPITSDLLREDLGIIYCMVSHKRSDRVARAAINAGAHGPIVYYSEGRGLRDRLGWLRITKEHEQEVLIVLADRAQINNVFDAVAKAGEFHLPGRGLMYCLDIDKGMFNLPSRTSPDRYAANMQQIIHAIDHLSGHTHWRDNGVRDVSAAGKTMRTLSPTSNAAALRDQVRLSAIVRRDDSQAFTDLVLEAGVPGLTVSHAFFTAADEGCRVAGARVNDEYALYRCILSQDEATQVGAAIEGAAECKGIRDLCIFANAVPRVARYLPGTMDYRAPASPHVALG